jgi:hypothetical protein
MAKLAAMQPTASSSTAMTTHGLTSVSAGPIFTSRTINVTISKAFPITLSGLRIFVENAGAKYINATPMSSGTNCCCRDNRQHLKR